MKKIFISLLSLSAFVASAQEETTITVEKTTKSCSGVMANSNKDLSFVSKNGHQILPQAGDWGLGISATNPLNYLGNFLSDGASGSNTFGAINGAPGVTNDGTTVFGKYFVNSHTAYRAWVTTQTNRVSTLSGTTDDGDPGSGIDVNDKRVQKRRGVLVGAGLEKRRGAGRLIGIYGVQAFVGLGQGLVTEYTYANEYSANNPNPSDAFNQNGTPVGGSAGDQRLLSSTAASEFAVGGQAFLGVEYFVAPKISLGGEFSFGASYRPSIRSVETVEYFDAVSGGSKEFTRETKGGANVNTGTAASFGGQINMNFYF